MLSIIICNEKIINDCKGKYGPFLEALKNDDFIFLEWKKEENNINDAVPKLQDIISKNREWRAIIINNYDGDNENVDNEKDKLIYQSFAKRNPFDIGESVGNFLREDEEKSPEQHLQDIKDGMFAKFYAKKQEKYTNALNNELVCLANWLMGPRVTDFETPRLTVQQIEEQEKELEKNFNDNPDFAKYQKEKLHELAVAKSIARRDEMLKEKFNEDNTVFAEYAPKQLIIISERIKEKDIPYNYDEYHFDSEYSNFAEENLYPYKTRFIIYDTKYNRNKEIDMENYFSFLTFINVFAYAQYPNDAVKPDRVYQANAVITRETIENRCNAYIARLIATKHYLEMDIERKTHRKEGKIDNETAEIIFESRKDVKVEVDSYYNEDSLFCEHKKIGVFTDTPINEKEYWLDQEDDIKKSFVKYMREPQRAVKVATMEELRTLNYVDDDRAYLLNDFQRENIQFELLGDEEKMVEVDASDIFDIDDYKKRMKEASRQVSRRIDQRMTKKKTFVSVVIAIMLFIIGCLPFIVSSFKDDKAYETSLTLSLIGLAVFAAIVIARIFYFRFDLIQKFKHFNGAVYEILDDIKYSLSIASEYLSYVCNIMRFFSTINLSNTRRPNTVKNMNKHLEDINAAINEASESFEGYVKDTNRIKVTDETEIFKYDFELEKRYKYEMPSYSDKASVEFFEKGNYVELPIDFVKKVSLEREELYD